MATFETIAHKALENAKLQILFYIILKGYKNVQKNVFNTISERVQQINWSTALHFQLINIQKF